MTPSPTLSVIIPCFRSGARLRDQIEALRTQTDRPDLEVLLCDNGGNPWLEAWVRDLPDDDPGFEVRRVDATAHRGAAYARNRGIAESRSSLLAFCDDDDLVHPRWARSAVELLGRHIVVTGGIVTRPDAEVKDLDLKGRRSLLVQETVPVPPRPAGPGAMGPALMGGNFAARKEVMLRVGGFDAGLVEGSEDNDLGYRLAAAGVPVTDCGEMSILYERPSGARDRIRACRRAGRSLGQATAARTAWDQAVPFRRPPVVELGKASASAVAMALGLKQRDLSGVTDRLATSWGLTEGWARYRLLARSPRSHIGLGLSTKGSGGAARLKPGTTVIVVAYNHQDHIRETLESIAAQTRRPTAVLITDDASPGAEATAAVVQDFLAGQDETWRYLPNPVNLGLNRTLNSLLRLVETEFVTYIAADDLMHPERLAVHEDLLRNAPEGTALAYSDADVIDENSMVLHPTSRTEFPWPEEPARSENTLGCLIRSNWVPAASIFLDTAALRDAGGYAEDLFYEDFELLTRLAARHRFVYTERPLVSVRRLSTSLGTTGFAMTSPRFIRALYAALGHAVDAPESADRALARATRWELAKRAAHSDMAAREALTMMVEARQGAATPAHALAHLVQAGACRLRPRI